MTNGPILPDFSDPANIRKTLKEFYYGEDEPAEISTGTIYGDIVDLQNKVSGIKTYGKAPIVVVSSTEPSFNSEYNIEQGIWLDTTEVNNQAATAIGKYYNNGNWEYFSGKASEDINYNWSGLHTFDNKVLVKNTINYFTDSSDRDAIFDPINNIENGSIAVVSNILQLYSNNKWNDISLPPSGNINYGLIKNTADDFDVTWSKIVLPDSNNNFSGINTFSNNTSFTNIELSGSATVDTNLTVNGTTTFNGDVKIASGKLIINGIKIWVQASQPENAEVNDIWIQA